MDDELEALKDKHQELLDEFCLAGLKLEALEAREKALLDCVRNMKATILAIERMLEGK